MSIKKQTEITVNIEDLKPNDWNPNSMDSETFQKLKNTLLKQGYTERIEATKDGEQYLIIDGEHRMRAIKELITEKKWTEKELKVILLEGYTDAELKLQTLNKNKLKGTHDPYGEATIIAEIKPKIDKFEDIIAYTKHELHDFEEILKEPADQIEAIRKELDDIEDNRPIFYNFTVDGVKYSFVVAGKVTAAVIDNAIQKSKGIDDNYKFFNICKLFNELIKRAETVQQEQQ